MFYREVLITLEVNARSLTHLDVCVPGVSLIISTRRWAAERKGDATQTSWGPPFFQLCVRHCDGGCGIEVGRSRGLHGQGEETWDVAVNAISSGPRAQ